jgi:hypothetical protein
MAATQCRGGGSPLSVTGRLRETPSDPHLVPVPHDLHLAQPQKLVKNLKKLSKITI